MPTTNGITSALSHPIVSGLVIIAVVAMAGYSITHYVQHQMAAGSDARIETLENQMETMDRNLFIIQCNLKIIPECQTDLDTN